MDGARFTRLNLPINLSAAELKTKVASHSGRYERNTFTPSRTWPPPVSGRKLSYSCAQNPCLGICATIRS